MILVVSNMRYVFRVQLQFQAQVLDVLVLAHSRGHHLQLQLPPASPFDIAELKGTSSRYLAKHLLVDGVLEPDPLLRRFEVPSEVFHYSRLLLLQRDDTHFHTLLGPVFLLFFHPILPKGKRNNSQELVNVARFLPILDVLQTRAVL